MASTGSGISSGSASSRACRVALLIQQRMLKGSGQTHGQLNFHWWLPVYGNTGL
jgi:hypothetical protein